MTEVIIDEPKEDCQIESSLEKTLERAKELEEKFEKSNLPADYIINDIGLYYLSSKKDAEPMWLSAPIKVIALSRNPNNEGFGKTVEFNDLDDNRHEYTIPMELLAGDGKDLRATLMSLGLDISPDSKARGYFLRYLQLCKPFARARTVQVAGWNGINCFVLPSNIIGGAKDEKFIFQSSTGSNPGFGISGTLNEWRDHISKPCIGNSRLIFAISLSFAAPLLKLLDEENGGFHFRGASSTGKTTALFVAGSVWGGKPYLQRWRTTSNGLEGIALAHNDTLLCLDEIGEMNPNESSEVAYMLANGQSKGRAEKCGKGKARSSWRILFLSSGEVSLEQHIAPTGKRLKGGHHVRVVEIPADTGKYGIFESLNGCPTGKIFSENLTLSSHRYYGVASIEFLTALVSDFSNTDYVKSKKREFLAQAPLGISSQEGRVLNRFALGAAAGELATKLGITGWDEGEATSAAWICFDAWIKSRGGLGSFEEKEALKKVTLFFQQFGKSRLSLFDEDESDKGISKRAGFRRFTEMENGAKFYVFQQVFKEEICNGIDYSLVVRACLSCGYLIPDAKGNSTRSERLPSGKCRVYVFSKKVLSETENLDESDETFETDEKDL